MTKKEKETAMGAAAAGVGAGVGGFGGATAGVLELAAQGAAVTGLTASAVIGAGAIVGGCVAYGLFRFFKKRAKPKPTAPTWVRATVGKSRHLKLVLRSAMQMRSG